QCETEVRHSDSLAIAVLAADGAGFRAGGVSAIELSLERVDRAERPQPVGETPVVVGPARNLDALLQEIASAADVVLEEREQAENVERAGDVGVVTQAAGERQALREPWRGALLVPDERPQQACSPECARTRNGRVILRRLQHALEPVEAVSIETAVEPEENERAGQAQAFDNTAGGGRVPLEGRAQVLVVDRQPIEPEVLLGSGHLRLRAE